MTERWDCKEKMKEGKGFELRSPPKEGYETKEEAREDAACFKSLAVPFWEQGPNGWPVKQAIPPDTGVEIPL